MLPRAVAVFQLIELNDTYVLTSQNALVEGNPSLLQLTLSKGNILVVGLVPFPENLQLSFLPCLSNPTTLMITSSPGCFTARRFLSLEQCRRAWGSAEDIFFLKEFVKADKFLLVPQ